jgi:serine/threonine protein kinase
MTDQDTLTGTRLGRYEIDSLIGRGGMGAVYKALDTKHKRTVALKVLLPDLAEDKSARKRFRQEIKHAITLGAHPHIIPVYEAEFRANHFYIVMALIDGQDLDKVLRAGNGRMEERRALLLIGQIANALDAVHDQELVHRDVKPHNVLVWRPGTDDEHAYLTDFGIARAVRDTQGATISGSPPYMAPEVFRGEAGPAADQFSLGCLAYELLSGRRPFDPEIARTSESALAGRPPSLRVVAPHVSAHVAEAVDVALATEPRDRHAGVREFVAATRDAEPGFDAAERMKEVVNHTAAPEKAVQRLQDEQGLSKERAEQILDPTARSLRRRSEARRRLLGLLPTPRPDDDD